MASSFQKFCLKWNDFRGIVTSAFDNLRHDEELVDVTLCCEGKQIKAHRMMLSACSPYFKDVLKGNPCQHPVFFMKDVSYTDMTAVIEFVYTGEVNVSQGNLSSFLKTAEMLQVKGLTDEDKATSIPHSEAAQSPAQPSTLSSSSSTRPGPLRAKRPVSTANPPAPATPPSFSPAAKRSRTDTAPVSRVVVNAPGYVPPAAEPSRDFPVIVPVTLPADPAPPLPPPPAPALAAADPPAPEVVHFDPGAVKTEDGESVDASLDAEDDYAGLLDFTSAEQALAAASEEGSGSQSGMFFREEPSTGRPEGDAANGAGWAFTRPCVYCGKIYRHRQSLYQHMQMHRGLTKCSVCDETMGTPQALKKHMRYRHGFESKVLRMLMVLRKEVNDLSKKYSDSARLDFAVESTFEDSVNFGQELPCSSVEALDMLETELTDKENFCKLKRRLRQIGGANIRSAVWRWLPAILTDSVASQFNLTGSKGKRRFRKLKAMQAVLEVSATDFACDNKTTEELVKKWLHNALDRQPGGRKKKTAATLSVAEIIDHVQAEEA